MVSYRSKSNWKFRFLRSFSETKTKESDLKVWNVCDSFGITIPCLGMYFVEVGAHASLKAGTKGCLRG